MKKCKGKKKGRPLSIACAALVMLCVQAVAGERTVTATVVAPAQQVVREADGTEHTPSWELRIPVWSPPAGVSVAALERVDVLLQPNTYTWTTVTNQSSQPRGWWQWMAGATGWISRRDVSGWLDPRASGFAVHEGAVAEYGSARDSLAPSATAQGYYWGPQQVQFSIHIGEGDRAAILEWARSTPGLPGVTRRFYGARSVVDWTAEWAGHASWQARVEQALPATFQVRYVYRDVPTGRALRAVEGPWRRMPPAIQQGALSRTYSWDGLPPEIDPSRVERVILESRNEHWFHSEIENVSSTPGLCGGLGYSCDGQVVNGTVMCGTSFSIGVGGGGQSFSAWDGTTDWAGTSGAAFYGNAAIQSLTRYDTDIPWPYPGCMNVWARTALCAPTMTVAVDPNPSSGIWPQALTPGADFAWDGRTAQATSMRLIWFVR